MAAARPHTERIGQAIECVPGVAAAWLIGSVARGSTTPDSDLDVALLLAPNVPEDLEALPALAVELERFSPSGRVDLIVLGAQGPVFRHRVLREGILLVDRDHAARVDFQARTFSEYFDWMPTHAIAMRSALSGLRKRFERGGT